MEKFEKEAIFWLSAERIEITLRRYDDSRLALSGNCAGSCGQCQDSIDAASAATGEESRPLLDLLDIWAEHHLKQVPDSVFERVIELLDQLDGQRIGEAPCLDDAPEIGGDIFNSVDAITRLEIYRADCILLGIPESLVDTFDNGANWPDGLPEILEDSGVIDEYLALRAFCADGAVNVVDWYFGATLIADSYFTEYAKDMVSDIGDLPNEIPSYLVIDWEETAHNLKGDYVKLTYNGVTYWSR